MSGFAGRWVNAEPDHPEMVWQVLHETGIKNRLEPVTTRCTDQPIPLPLPEIQTESTF